MQAAIACFAPKREPTVIPTFQPADFHAKCPRAAPVSDMRTADAGYFLTGVRPPTCAATPEKEPSAGEPRKPYPLFAADAAASSSNDAGCTKHQYASGMLGPGLLVRVALSALCAAQ